MRRVSFISGTRADYGKIKPYVSYLVERAAAEVYLFLTGMHMDKRFGNTRAEIERDFGATCRLITDKAFQSGPTAAETAHVMAAYDRHLRADKIDFCFVHGDRSEAFGAAAAAALNNVGICHLEAGDVSGSIDESLRHAVSKLSHRFFVCDERARQILIRMGEDPASVFVTGNSSLAYDFGDESRLFSQSGVPFETYAVLIYHPVTTLPESAVRAEIEGILTAAKASGLHFVVIRPNNDLNSEAVRAAYRVYADDPQFCFFDSLPFEVFNAVLRRALFLVGNSSCGIKEAPFYGVPCLDVGERQHNRATHLNFKDWKHVDDVTKLPRLMRVFSNRRPKKVSLPPRRSAFFTLLDGIMTDAFWYPDKQKRLHFLKE